MLKFEFTVDEANLLLSALAKQPFEVVAQLIGKMRQEAEKQMAAQQAAEQKPE